MPTKRNNNKKNKRNAQGDDKVRCFRGTFAHVSGCACQEGGSSNHANRSTPNLSDFQYYHTKSLLAYYPAFISTGGLTWNAHDATSQTKPLDKVHQIKASNLRSPATRARLQTQLKKAHLSYIYGRCKLKGLSEFAFLTYATAYLQRAARRPATKP
eukprot:1186500-Prorocentrum_minimum.AAC.5